MAIHMVEAESLFFIDQEVEIASIFGIEIVQCRRRIDENATGLAANLGGFQFEGLTGRANFIYGLLASHGSFRQFLIP